MSVGSVDVLGLNLCLLTAKLELELLSANASL